jgi:host factor-I protein
MITMVQERALTLQDTFLTHVQEQSVPVTVFLVNGIKLQGYITRFDRFGLALTRDHHTQFIFKHAISTIDPMRPIQLYVEPKEVGS